MKGTATGGRVIGYGNSRIFNKESTGQGKGT